MTGTGKTHLAIAIARSCIRAGSRGRFFTTVDLVNRLEAETRAGRQGRIADYLTRMDFVVLDELGYLPFAQAGGQLLCRFLDAGMTRGGSHSGGRRPKSAKARSRGKLGRGWAASAMAI